MMRLTTIAFLLWSCVAIGADDRATLNFTGVSVQELVRVVYGELLREDYVMDGAFLADKSEIAMDLRGVSASTVRGIAESAVRASGFTVEKVGKVWRFGTAGKVPADEMFFYRPKFRSVSYLSDMLASLFPRGSFSFQRGGFGGVSAMQGQQGVQLSGVSSPNGPMAAQPSSAVGSTQGARAGAPVGGGGQMIDRDLDAFIFRGTVGDVARLEKLLAQVDVAAGEVMVKAVVYEVRHSQQEGSAVSIVASILGGRIGAQYGGPPLANSLTMSVGGLRAVVSALSTDSRFKVLSAPSVRLQSGGNARFTVGDETPVLGAVTYQPNGQAVQSVDYRPSGVILDIKPFVRDELVELTVFQQLSSFTVTATGVNNSPTMLKRELSTTLGVKPGETVVLGGLEDSRGSQDRNGLPFLPAWLSSRGSSHDRTEVLLVLDVQRI